VKYNAIKNNDLIFNLRFTILRFYTISLVGLQSSLFYWLYQESICCECIRTL